MQVSHALNPRRIARSLVTVLVLTLVETVIAPVVAPLVTTSKAEAIDVAYASYTAGTDVVVPAGAVSVTITARGGAGGTGGNDASAGLVGSNVGYASGTFTVTPGDRITMYPGGAGGNGATSASNSGGGTAGSASLVTSSNTLTPAFKFNGTYYNNAWINGGTGGNAGAGGSSGSGGGGGAGSIVIINEDVALVAAGGGGGAGGSGPGAQPWNGTYQANTEAKGATGIYGGGCGNTDGGGSGGGGGGWQGGAAGAVDRPGGTGECRAFTGSPGANWVSNAGTSTSNIYTTANGAGLITYSFTFASTTACSTTSQIVDIYTVVKVTTTANCTWSVPANVSTVDLFLVGGGGGGAGDAGPGGNGGYATSRTAVPVTPSSTMTLKVGYGGAGSSWGFTSSAYVGDSTTVVTSTGALYSALGGQTGGNGPSVAAGTPSAAANGSFAGGKGGNGAGCFNVGTAGSRGVSNYFTGSLVAYAGGGGAGACPNGAITTPAPGADGGGQGGYASSTTVNQPGTAGTANTGGGGGGGTANGTGMKLIGGKGGSGVILIRYATNTADAFPASVASAIAGRWIPGDLQMLDSSRKGWMDSSGTYTGATVVGTPSVVTQGTLDSGNSVGSTRSNLVVAGGTADNVTLVASNIADYTMFHIERYVSGGAQKRVITASGNNWLSGLYSSGTYGAAHHVNNWMTPTSTASNLKFLLSTDNLRYYRANGSDVTYDGNTSNVTGASGPTGLGINVYSTEVSNWQFLDMIIFNRELTNGEIRAMETYLARIYGLSLSDEFTYSDTDTAVTMDGNQYLRNQSLVASPINDTFTAEAWIKPDTACGTGGGSRCALFARENTLMFGVYNGYFYYLLYGTNTVWEWVDSTYKIPVNEWHHISLVKRGIANTNNSVELYLDGKLVYTKQGSPYAAATTAATYAATDKVRATTDQWTYIGTRLDTLDRWRGTFDEIKFWKVARTASEIESDMTNRDLTNTNLQLYYDFNRDVATTTNNTPNLAYGGTNRNELKAFSNLTITYNDVKTVTTAANNPYTTVTFPRTYITQNGGWKVPDSVTAVALLVVGGGGGGAGVYSTDLNSGGGGGGGGGVFAPASSIDLTNNRIVPVIVGAGGIGGGISATRDGASGSSGQTSYFANLSAGGGGAGGYVTSTNANGLNGTSAGGGGGASNYWLATNAGYGGLSQPTTFAGQTWQGFDGGNGAIFVNGSSASGDAAPGGGASTSATRTTIGGGIQSSLSGSATAYGRGGSARGVTGWSFANVSPNLGTGGSGQFGTSAPGGYGSSGVVIVRWITALKPKFTQPTNAYLNVGMTETFTTNVAQDSATALLTRTFRWESTTGGANGTYVAVKTGTGATNAAYSWVPSDTSTSGSQYLYRVVVTDSDSYGLFITDTSTPVFAVINKTLLMSGPSIVKKQINVARNETFTISQGTPGYRYSLTPAIPGVTLDTSTVGTTILKISDTASAGTYLVTLTLTDSVSASVAIPINLVISAPPSLVNTGEIVDNDLEFSIDMSNSASYSRSTGLISDLSGTKKQVTVVGGSTFSDDYSGNLKLSTSQYISATGFRTLPSFTIEAYINLQSISTGQVCVFGSEQTPTNVPYFLCIDSGRTIFTGFFNGSWTYKRTSQYLTLGEWTHLAGVFDSTTAGTKMELYVNGSVATWSDSAENAGLIPPSTTSDKIFINKWFYTTTAPTSAMDIGFIRLYRAPLSAANVLKNYNATKSRFASENFTQVKPAQKYGAITLESFTVTSGGDTKTVSFAVGNRSGISWDTSIAGTVKLSVLETLTPGTYYDTVTVTDNFSQSTFLPIKFTVSKADTLTIYIDTPTALNYTGNRAIYNSTLKTIGAVGFESGTALSVTTKFKPAGTTCATGGYCRVGDIGPGGGIVFIDTSTASSDGRIYEVAPQNWSGSDDLSTVATFCSNHTANIGSTQFGIGWGETNTTMAKTSCLGGAVAKVNSFNQSNSTGYSDWFIPSKNEAIELVKIPATAGLLNIGNNWTVGNWGYWTSTEAGATTMASIGHSGAVFNASATVNKSEAVKNMVRPVRAFKSCWAIDTCTAIATTETPTAAGVYVITPSNAINALDLEARYTSVRYVESRLTINRIAQRAQVIPFVNTVYPETFTVNVTEGNGNGALTLTVVNGTASGCTFDYKKLATTSQGTCIVTATKAGDRNYLPDTANAAILFLAFVVNQPAPAAGTGPNIALSGITSITLDSATAPTISSLSTYSAIAGQTSIIINGAGFDHNNLAGITVKFWRNQVASGFTVNSGDSQITVTVPAGATTGKVTVTTPNGIAVSELPLTVTTP